MKSKGFTLIELLVVISIIGVISSIVLVSFSGSRDKARLAKAQNFDAQISHALGAYAVSIWRFEEGAGITAHDESGYGNDGTLGNGACTPGNGSCPSWAIGQGVYSGTNALNFDGNDYVDCDNANLDADFTKLTISFWMYATPGSSSSDAGLVGKGTSIYGMTYHAGATVYFYIVNGGHNLTQVVNQDEWHHIVGTFTGTHMYLYVDGVLKKDKTSSFFNTGTGGTFTIGKSTTYFNGSIDDVRIYDEALSSTQIQQIYVAGAASHGIAINDN